MTHHWQRNLIVIWISQFLSMVGFSFSMPFVPYYVQELGVTDPVRLKFWISIFAASAALPLAIFSPIWGTLADRYGRRPMLLRASFSATVILALMGAAQNVQTLVLLRVLQGVLTGTFIAAQALVVVQTPEHRSGLALGALSAAVYCGNMVGMFLGGIVAHYLGYRMAFFASSLLLLTSGMAIVFGTSEKFVPKGELGSALFKIGWPRLGVSLPILLLILFMAFVQQFDTWFLPLLVQDVHGSLKGVSVWTGSLGAVGGVAGFLAGVILGRLADRMSPPRVAKFSAVGAAVMMIPQGLAHTFLVLFPARFCMTFCAAGLDPVFQIWLAKVTPEDRRGFIFGWVGTAKALGWMAAPLASGLVASGFGVRAIYFVECLLFLLLIPCIGMVVRAIAGNGATRRAGA